VYFNGHDDLASLMLKECSLGVIWPWGDADFVNGLPCLSESVDGDAVIGEALAKSKAFPGVLGVFEAEPKEANAPEPSPNADLAPGDAVVPVFTGKMPLKAAFLAVVDMSWDRFEVAKRRG